MEVGGGCHSSHICQRVSPRVGTCKKNVDTIFSSQLWWPHLAIHRSQQERNVDQNATKTEAPQAPILVVGPDEAAKMTAHSRSGIYKAIAAGELISFKSGKRRMILVRELETWINRVARENAR